MTQIDSDKTYGIYATAQNKTLIAALKSKNAAVIEFEPGEFIKTGAANDERIFDELEIFDWLIFTDPVSTEYFLEELQARDFDLFEMDEKRVCSYGEAVADRLRFVQLHSDIIAQKISDHEIYTAISGYIGGETFDARNFLIVKSRAQNFEIAEMLTKRGARVAQIALSEYQLPTGLEFTKHKTLLKSGSIDEFFFGSVEDVWRYKFQFRNEFNAVETIRGTDEITLKTLDEFGVKAFYFQK